MAVDKKGDFVGDHGGKYVDQDGLTKQFTYVDHDVKLKVGFNTLTPFNIEWDRLDAIIIKNSTSPKYKEYLSFLDKEYTDLNLGEMRELAKILLNGNEKIQSRTNKASN